jgi:hypothetical protein
MGFEDRTSNGGQLSVVTLRERHTWLKLVSPPSTRASIKMKIAPNTQMVMIHETT